MSRIHRRRGVDDDIYQIAVYLLGENESAAHRFVDAVQNTLKNLAQMPGMGSIKNFQDPALFEVRSWRVHGFRNYLIYYFIVDDGIDVLAILHGARDIERLLEDRV